MVILANGRLTNDHREIVVCTSHKCQINLTHLKECGAMKIDQERLNLVIRVNMMGRGSTEWEQRRAWQVAKELKAYIEVLK